MKVSPDVRLPALGFCIYCLPAKVSNDLTEEHIVPLSLGGNLILPDATCPSCRDITAAVTGYCCERIFKSLRVHQEFPSRRRRRPTELNVIAGSDPNVAPIRSVSVADHPGFLWLPVFTGAPGILIGSKPGDLFNAMAQIWTGTEAEERVAALKKQGFENALPYAEFELGKFTRLLAIIAHSYAMAHYRRLGDWRPLLIPLIKGADINAAYLIGGAVPPVDSMLPPIGPNSLHQLISDTKVVNNAEYIIVQIRLFSHLNPLPPIYTLVAGKIEGRREDPASNIPH
jgi:hypothetical protein